MPFREVAYRTSEWILLLIFAAPFDWLTFWYPDFKVSWDMLPRLKCVIWMSSGSAFQNSLDSPLLPLVVLKLFFKENITCLHFQPFFVLDMALLVRIIQHESQVLFYPAVRWSTVMTWWRTEPGHQQQLWYWSSHPGRFRFPAPCASYQIRIIAGCACAGNAGNVITTRATRNFTYLARGP